ncbi:MAG: AMP-binding protein, partial [Alphaproteobacteria bacterium]|nr:AMP-binding protein [Alphaproteobacteria bacterium]
MDAIAEIEPSPIRSDTLPTLFWKVVAERGGAVAMREKHLGVWRSISWAEFGETARWVGMGLVALGVESGDAVCILSNNNPEWLFADMGALGVGAVSVGIYPTDSPAQVAYVVGDCQAKVILVEDDEQLDKALTVREQVPSLVKIVVFDMDGLRDFHDAQVISFDSLLELGQRHGGDHPGLWERRLAEPNPRDLAILVYTSGTTGPPKGAMLSHRNILHALIGGQDLLPALPGDERLSFLPLCHVAERVLDYYESILSGAVLNFAESAETVPENIREVQPTVFLAVPRIWEKFYSAITIAMSEATPLARWAYGRAIAVGEQVAECRLERRDVPVLLKLRYWLAYHLVLRNVRRMLGLDRCRWLGTGAAPISPDLIKWYLALGFLMFEGYGQTESAGFATVMPLDHIKLGTIGKPVPFVDLEISPENEILVRGENVFMGYYNQPDLTAETIRDGWLHTG